MGLVNFVGRFIPNLATVSEPITKLMHKNAEFIWSKPQQDAFAKIKSLMGKAETLAQFEHKSQMLIQYYCKNSKVWIVS